MKYKMTTSSKKNYRKVIIMKTLKMKMQKMMKLIKEPIYLKPFAFIVS